MSSAELTVTLSPAMAELIERKMKSGVYTSASEVVQDGLRALQDEDAAMERWLCDEVVPGHAEYRADPSTAITADELLDRIQARSGSTVR